MARERSFAIVVLFGLVASAASTKGAAPVDAGRSLAPWFESLQRPDGTGSCCSTADCRRVQSRLGSQGYELFLDGLWVAVPAKSVIHRDNPTGEAVACTRGHLILCFVPAPEA